MAENINTIHQSGWTYPDVAGSQNGINFFKVPDNDYSRVTAGNFTLSDEVLESVYNIAGSSEEVVLDSYPTNTGNNDIALQLSGEPIKQRLLRQAEQHCGKSGDCGQYKREHHGYSSNRFSPASTRSVNRCRRSRWMKKQRILIIFQQSITGGQIISVLDDMLNTMINNMGITGR